MSSSNIIVRVRYKSSVNRSKAIKKWSDYVSNKDKADDMSLDNNDELSDYLHYSNNDFLEEKNEEYLWNSNGDARLNKNIKNLDIDQNGNVWDMVISFDSHFAYQKGLITKRDFYKLTNNVMPTFLTELGFDLNNISWYAGLHRNTKSPHIHLIFYENKIRNHFKVIPQSSIYKLKSSIANYLIDNTKFYELRDKEFKTIASKISFDELTKVKGQKLFGDKYRRELNKMLLELYSKLPTKNRLQYNSKNLKPFKRELDSIIDFILTNDPIKNNYETYYNLLEEHQRELNSVYGESSANKNNKYVLEQIHRLYSKIGNDILTNFKRYSSQEQMENEINFLKKNIIKMNFRSVNYQKSETIIKIGKLLYTICNMCEVSESQRRKIFNSWIHNSKYGNDVDLLLLECRNDEKSLSTTEYYSAMSRLGYSYDRLKKIKDKNFYKELNYKIIVNRALNHLMYEYEKEQKEIVREMEYELEGL